jgi:hypothetical protein
MAGVFQCNVFQLNVFQNDCAHPVTDEHHGGLFLDPPKGWRAIDAEPPRRRGRTHGPLYPDKVLTHIDFNRDDEEELWLLGLIDLPRAA